VFEGHATATKFADAAFAMPLYFDQNSYTQEKPSPMDHNPFQN